jgi:hypothetical protein
MRLYRYTQQAQRASAHVFVKFTPVNHYHKRLFLVPVMRMYGLICTCTKTEMLRLLVLLGGRTSNLQLTRLEREF